MSKTIPQHRTSGSALLKGEGALARSLELTKPETATTSEGRWEPSGASGKEDHQGAT